MRNPNRRPSHPGKILREIVIPDVVMTHKVTKSAIAEALGLSRNQFYAILREEQPVTPTTAVSLEAAFGGSAKTWLNMQAAYDLWGAEREVDTRPAKELLVA